MTLKRKSNHIDLTAWSGMISYNKPQLFAGFKPTRVQVQLHPASMKMCAICDEELEPLSLRLSLLSPIRLLG